MAAKEYAVKKDGEVLKTYKSLTAAKQLAEKEMANVYVGDECVYKVVPEEKNLFSPDAEKEKPTAEPEKAAEKFVLTALMNVRTAPSMTAPIKTTLPAGTEVEVDVIKDDWLYLVDGTFIFYNGGKFAERR